MRITGLEPVSP